MARYFARIVRALIVSCLGFGGGIGLLVFIITLVVKGDQHAFQYGLQSGLLFGGIFAVMLVGIFLPLDITARLSQFKGNYKELWELEQAREVQFEGPLKEAASLCRKALLAVPNVKLVTEDMENLVIRASVGASWRSPGESMEVEINPVAEDSWNLRCTSSSPSANVVFDYGKNFENVEAWMKEINALLNTPKQAAS